MIKPLEKEDYEKKSLEELIKDRQSLIEGMQKIEEELLKNKNQQSIIEPSPEIIWKECNDNLITLTKIINQKWKNIKRENDHMLDVQIYDLTEWKEKEITRVICVSKYKNQFVFSYNKKRKGWEIPGGHVEGNETWEEAVKREMYEETGATKVKVEPISIYKINSFGLLCYCEILEIGELPKEYEMEKIMFSKTLPRDLTFPDSSKIFFETVKNKKGLE